MAIKLNNQTKKQLALLTYKLSNDALSLWLAVFFAFLVLEGLVPGYFAAFLSFTKIIFILFVLLAGIAWLGRRNRLAFDFTEAGSLRKNKSAIAALVIAALLIINASKSLGIFAIAVVAVVALLILILFYEIFILQEK